MCIHFYTKTNYLRSNSGGRGVGSLLWDAVIIREALGLGPGFPWTHQWSWLAGRLRKEHRVVKDTLLKVLWLPLLLIQNKHKILERKYLKYNSMFFFHDKINIWWWQDVYEIRGEREKMPYLNRPYKAIVFVHFFFESLTYIYIALAVSL